jgi:hypothetical protein
MSGQAGYWRRFLPLWAVGLAGLLSLLLQPLPPAVLQAPQVQHLPLPVLRALLLVNPFLLLTLMALLGAALAHRVGLGSRLAGTYADRSRRWTWQAPAIGLATAALILALDLAWMPSLGEAWRQLEAQTRPPLWRTLPTGMLYGGITEEVMLRWGLMSAVAWALARMAGARPAVYVAAAVIAALLFGAGHLPAMAQVVELTPAVATRTVVLNAVAGLAYGLLFWKRGLEAAMVAHAATHAGFALARPFT